MNQIQTVNGQKPRFLYTIRGHHTRAVQSEIDIDSPYSSAENTVQTRNQFPSGFLPYIAAQNMLGHMQRNLASGP
jgi:hypothetical protein